MSISDWTINKAGSITVALEIYDPKIDGISSLKMASQDPGGSANLFYTDITRHGLPSGKIRTLIQHTVLPVQYKRLTGIMCMQSIPDMVADLATGQCYLFVFNALDRSCAVMKATSGLTNAQVLVTSSADYWDVNTTYCIELEWYQSVDLGGIQLIARRGVAKDYSDLISILEVTDSTSPILTTVAEGPVSADLEAGSGATLIDNTIVYRRT